MVVCLHMWSCDGLDDCSSFYLRAAGIDSSSPTTMNRIKWYKKNEREHQLDAKCFFDAVISCSVSSVINGLVCWFKLAFAFYLG